MRIFIDALFGHDPDINAAPVIALNEPLPAIANTGGALDLRIVLFLEHLEVGVRLQTDDVSTRVADRLAGHLAHVFSLRNVK